MGSALQPLILFTLFLQYVNSNYFNPHLFPKDGPFFEGFYMRITDFDNSNSLGLLFGRVLKKAGDNHTNPLVIASILWRNCTSTNTCTLTSSDATFSPSQLKVTANGEAVTANPDKTSPANFTWLVTSGSEGGDFTQYEDTTIFNFRIGNLSFRGELGAHMPWGPDGGGPEGWLYYLPLPLHWFVYSLRSPVISYELKDITSGKSIKGRSGMGHLEKNWGDSFPSEWIWSEGVSNSDQNISFALSGGLVEFGALSVHAYLIGYRHEGQGLSIDIRPDNSIVTVKQDGCAGQVNISASTLSYDLEFQLAASPNTFSSCLLAPEIVGFRKACVESYDATVKIVISKRSIFGLYSQVVDQQTINNAALEFGGKYVCNNKCAS